MDWKAHLRTALADDGSSPDEDVLEELSQHAAAAYDAARSEGCSHADAVVRIEHLIAEWRRGAPLLRRRSVVRLPDTQPHAPQWFAGTLHDVRYGFRTLRREPGYTTLVITLMALGIAATTTLVSVTAAVLLKPLPWPGSERLVRLEERREGRSGRVPWTISNSTYLAWRESPSSTVEEIGGWTSVPSTFRGAGDPERIRIARITPSAFSVVKARPAMGRLFNEDDAGSPATTTTAILSRAFWRQRFNGATDAIGRTIQLDERPYAIVGVMRADFAFPDRETQVWIPQPIQPVASDGGKRISVSIFAVLARMRPGVTPEQVAAEATSRARAGEDLGPAGLALFGSRAAPTIVAEPTLDVLTGEVRPALAILLVAVLLLLTTAVGSIAILQLARAARRHREITVRAALGARTIHLTRQWVIESALAGMAGGLAGIAGAAVLLRINLLTARLPLAPRTTFAQAAPMLEGLQERLRAVPGASEAAFGNALPLVSAGGLSGPTVPSPRDPAVMLQIQALHRTVSPSYFDAMGLRLIAGRRLNVGDSAGSTSAVVVNRSFAAQYLGDNPVGQRLNFRSPGAGTGATVGKGGPR